jgi:hypothetical protein
VLRESGGVETLQERAEGMTELAMVRDPVLLTTDRIVVLAGVR